MSGPYCKSCVYYNELPLYDGLGECSDPTKIIQDKAGNRASESPEVNELYSCPNHSSVDKDFLESRVLMPRELPLEDSSNLIRKIKESTVESYMLALDECDLHDIYRILIQQYGVEASK